MPESPDIGGVPPKDPALDGAVPDDAVSDDAVSLEEHLLAEEIALGGDAVSRKVNDGLRALARAARSFLLYDPGNEAIRAFLDAYRTAMRAALAAVDEDVALAVRPFELVWKDEIVYLERDRERSLAFRLFRDGVRRVTVRRDVPWDELLTFLQIMSIRYTGVRQQEEDIVTLLWKAGFKGIDIVAVEGFEAEDEDDDAPMAPASIGGREDEGLELQRIEAFASVPADFDLPIPSPLPPGQVRPRHLTPEELAPLHAEASSQVLPALCVRLVGRVLRLVADPVDPTEWSDVEHLVLEVRDFLLAEGQLQNLLAIVHELDATRVVGEAKVERFLRSFVDARAMARIVHSVPASHTELPAELLELLDLIPGYHLLRCLDVLEQERSASSRRISRQLVERYAHQDVDVAIDRMRTAEEGVCADLLRCLHRAVPERTPALVDIAIETGAPEPLFEVLHVLAAHEASDWVPGVLTRLLDAPLEEIRVRAMGQLAELGPRRVYPVLDESLHRRSRAGISNSEAEAYGRTMVQVAPGQAIPAFLEIVKPKSLLKRIVHDPIGHASLQWAAVAGLELAPGEEPDQSIRWLADRAGEELARHCLRVLARRKRGGNRAR